MKKKKKKKKRNSVPTPTLCPEGLFITIKTELFSTLFVSSNWKTCWLMKAVIAAFHPSWFQTTWDQVLQYD